jgi:replicative DNA helicase
LQTNIKCSDIYRDTISEENIIQSLYLEPELIYQVDIRDSDITHVEYRKLYLGMLRLFSDGITTFDIKAIADASGVDMGFVIKTISNAVTSANIKYHAEIVKSKSFNRKCREILKALDKEQGNDDFLAIAEKQLSDLHDFHKRNKYIGLQELISNVQAQINEAEKNKEYGIPTGFTKLNDHCIGLCPRHWWIIGAYTSYGKSTFLSQMIDDICKAGHSMVVFSVEDSKEDKLIRLYATKTGIPIKYIVQGKADKDKIAYARKDVEKFDLQIYDDIYTLDEMDMKIRKHKIQNTVDVVAIDFVQNIITGGESIYDRMSEVAIKLQRMAKKHNVSIVALSQVSEGKEKGSISLRGAQELASSADIVLWIDRKPDQKEFDLIIRKNRPFGVTGKIKMEFTETWTGIREQ